MHLDLHSPTPNPRTLTHWSWWSSLESFHELTANFQGSLDQGSHRRARVAINCLADDQEEYSKSGSIF